ncbi:Superoxide dismutase [Wickerhamomyces ciferrii]|uniref:superoxide dismutase n=1 Tax=Wickerhamomyces ciferrii (strain ATCC 14091 / BCRC 22168 / CBS 111 / JCM 3599 / NBRC 0793 / NRRL Y-1031 F-60-10) TaxID=1206466 RepID=K0KJY9_WICCF|nr:Superoxide dismutase [Wickerhamomyces ciferrii]CCH45575.1 Superoxide dismutase [Wickerhamomyces ciferrii]
MVSIKQLFLASLPTLSIASDAKQNSDSPEGSELIANFPQGGSNQIHGYVKFTGLQNGSVQVDAKFENLPKEGGPFQYHIHEAPVPSNGSCLATLAHFNPNHGNKTDCPSQHNNAGCELGDLSGKHGYIPVSQDGSFETSYVDEWLSINPQNDYYFGNGDRSLTLHYANTSRIACANFESKQVGGSNGTNGSSSSVPPVSTADSLGNSVGMSGVAIIAGIAAYLI